MERLTRRDSERQDFVLVDRPRGALCRTNFCNIADRCVHIPDRSCPYLMISDRLAAIEDILGDEYELDRLRELVEADRDGCCVVLPCKPGDIVYQINQTDVFPIEVKKLVYDCGYIAFDDDAIGKYIFLNGNDAEAALKAREQDG